MGEKRKSVRVKTGLIFGVALTDSGGFQSTADLSRPRKTSFVP